MPVIEIRTQDPPRAQRVEEVLTRINEAVASAIDTPVSHVWSYWTQIPDGQQVRETNTTQLGSQEALSPLINVIAYRGRDAESIAGPLQVIDKLLCQAQGIPLGSSFITWTEVPPRRVFTGGSVRDG